MQKFVCALALAALAGSAQSQVASAQVREGDTVDGNAVTAINNSAVNGQGGYGFTLTTAADGGSESKIWGSYNGGAGSTIRTEGTFAGFLQTSFESFFGMGSSSVGYSPSTTRLSDNTTGLDAVWVDDMPVQTEEDPVGMRFSSFNSRVGMTHDNRPYWVGGLTDTVGGGTLDRALFFDGNILFQSGDAVAGLGTASPGSSVDFDFRFSEMGTNWLSPIDFDTGSTVNDIAMVLNGNAYMAGGGFVREADLIAPGVGALAGESWDNFDFMGVNEAGDVFFTGDTDAVTSMDEFVFQNGSIILREGDTVDGLTISGSIEGGYQNGSGDWGVIWDVDRDGSNVEALIVNGDLILAEGDSVDWNGDGVIDINDMGATIDNFTGISTLTLGERAGPGGAFDIAFTADVQLATGEILEGGFLLTVPAPGASVAIAAGGLLMARRRR